MVPIYYDAEFTGLHRNSTLISIGFVSQSGAYFYAEFNDYDKSQVNDWLQEHVIDNLWFNNYDSVSSTSRPYTIEGSAIKHFDVVLKNNHDVIKEQLLSWIANETWTPDKVVQAQIYTDCYAYDWVLLNDLICKDGHALNLPDYINYIPIDLSTSMFLKGVDPDITREDFIGETEVHNIIGHRVFNNVKGNPKHNSLWDAFVAKACYEKLFKM